MTDPNHHSNGVFQTEGEAKPTSAAPRRARLLNRKTTLALSTILGLGLLVPLAGTAVVSTVQQARAAEAVVPDTFVAPTGFEDLVEAVMPAVVAVRVEAPQPVETSNRDIDRLPDGTPFDRFSVASGRKLRSFSAAVQVVEKVRATHAVAAVRAPASSFLRTAIWSPTTM